MLQHSEASLPSLGDHTHPGKGFDFLQLCTCRLNSFAWLLFDYVFHTFCLSCIFFFPVWEVLFHYSFGKHAPVPGCEKPGTAE